MMKRRSLAVLAGAVMASVLLAGCGGSSSSQADRSYKEVAEDTAAAASEAYYDYDGAVEEEYEYATDDVYGTNSAAEMPEEAKTSGSEQVSDSELQSSAASNRKLIKTVNMSAETREFDKLISNITARINELGGYAESMDVNGNSYDTYSTRNAYIVARIPATKLDMFVKDISDASNITSKSESAEDVTLQYADVEAHKESLKIEQKRLNELLEQADTLENIIELENRLTEVRYEIESYESRLRMMNNQVVYATVNLSVQEVKEYTPEPVDEKSFGERLVQEFTESCEDAWEFIQDFIIGFVAFLPTLLVLLIILFIIFIIVFGIVKAIIAVVKASNRKKAVKKAARPAPQPQKAAPPAAAEKTPGSEAGNAAGSADKDK
ncbi:MAG: DUF4349 domain-containing protein [Lachnospiraceae bacterium]|nr:DUF4349 domain-containing protein [Lachnospiraceae bacterium]